MKAAKLFFILLGLGPSILHACSCMPTSLSFSLMRYDEAELIVEVVIGERFEDEQSSSIYDLSTYRKELKKAEAEGRVPPPPPPPIQRTGKVRTKVEAVLKGSFNTDELILKFDLDGSTCGWLPPAAGKRYIFYLGKPANEEETVVYWVGSCGRKLNALAENFDAEKRMLTKLSVAADGPFSEKQVVDMQTGPMEYFPFKGSFKDGKRDGDWLIYSPVYSWRDTLDFHQPVLVLEYDLGKLNGSRDLVRAEKNSWFNWVAYWKLFYFDRFEKD